MTFRLLLLIIFTGITAVAQQLAPPVPERFGIHSKILNEDRVIFVRTPPGYDTSKNIYPVLYETDAPGHINESGGSMDFLVTNGRMPPLIIVGIANTDRTRDLTPSRVELKNPDGTTDPAAHSGGADKFLEFIQTELVPEIDKKYRTAPYRIFAGHSLGGLLAIHALIAHPDLFNAYIAVSPSLQWDGGRTLHQAQQYFATHRELNKTLFFSLGNEGNTPNPMGQNFDEFHRTLVKRAPKGLRWDWARYPDEDHGSTVLRAHYAGLRFVFDGWQVPRDDQFQVIGGLAGMEKHFEELSKRFGYNIPIPENALNNFGYVLLGQKHFDEAIKAFKRNIELYPGSPNVYDSLGEALEAAGKSDAAAESYKKAVELGQKTNDGALPQFQQHLKHVTVKAKM